MDYLHIDMPVCASITYVHCYALKYAHLHGDLSAEGKEDSC